MERGSLKITHKANIVAGISNLKLCSIQRVTKEEVLITFRDMNKNYDVMDPIPIRPFRQVFCELSIYIARINDWYFLQELFPFKLKHTVENPVAKHQTMDTENNKYRPNTTTASYFKMMKKVILTQINSHVPPHSAYTAMKSGYKKGHS